MSYPEIEQLKSDFERFDIRISRPKEVLRNDLFFVDVSINNNTWTILIDDEYGDFSPNNPMANWFLVLFSLEGYAEAEDILEWGRDINFNAVEHLLDHYKSLAITYREIEEILGTIDARISSFDYQMRTGVVKTLTNK